MRRERRQPTASEWGRITSRRPVVHRIPKQRLSRRRHASKGGGGLLTSHAYRRTLDMSDPPPERNPSRDRRKASAKQRT
jgi:hypothetical protein